MDEQKISKIRKASKIQILMGLCLFLFAFTLMPDQEASAMTPISPVTIDSVDYEEENIIVNNNGNSKIYFATEVEASKDNWEIMPADPGATTEIDFSWVSPGTENILKIKGEDITVPAGVQLQKRIILKERARKLEISIMYASINALDKDDTIAPLLNIMSSVGTADNPITYEDLEWKKGETGKWKDIDDLTVAQLEKYQIKGADLYFRIMAVNDVTDKTDPLDFIYPDGSKGRRVSNEVKVKIAKKAASMVVGIDGAKFKAEIEYGQEYRVTIGAVTTGWEQVTDRATTNIPLADIVNDGSDGTTNPFPGMFLEIRDYATTKKAASKITEIELNLQREILGDVLAEEVPLDVTPANQNIYLNYYGNKNIVITIPSASLDNPYEYCIVKPSDTFDLERVIWYSVTKSSGANVLASKAVDGGILYIRQKEIKSRAKTRTSLAVEYKSASTYVSHDISYPSVPDVFDESFTYIKGIGDDPVEFDIRLNISGRIPFETEIGSIKLGNKIVLFDTDTDPDIGDPLSDIMKVTLRTSSLEELPNCYYKDLFITFKNGTIEKSSIKLTIKSPTLSYALSASAAKGATSGTTVINVVSPLGVGNVHKVYISDTLVENVVEEGIASYTGVGPYTSGNMIPVTAGKYVTVFEIDDTGLIKKYKCIQITADLIG